MALTREEMWKRLQQADEREYRRVLAEVAAGYTTLRSAYAEAMALLRNMDREEKRIQGNDHHGACRPSRRET